MKKLNILVISALAALTLAACNTPSSSEASSSSQTSPSSAPNSDYLFYQLKEGQTKDGLEGALWVNSVTWKSFLLQCISQKRGISVV